MKQYTLIYLLLAIGFAFAACQPAAEHNPALIGQWTGKNWLVNDQLSNRDAGQVFFEFNADGTYAAGFGQQREAGRLGHERKRKHGKHKHGEREQAGGEHSHVRII